jgi:Tol biopolymer transport system component
MLLLLAHLAHADTRELASKDGANIERPVFSADATKLAWQANFHEKKQIELYVGDPRTAAFRKVAPAAHSATAATAGFQTVAAAGVVQELAFGPPAMGRYVYAATTDALDQDIFIGTSALASAPGADGGPAWSPDGKLIAFTSSRTGQGDLYLVDTAAVDAAPRRLTTDPDASELFASWSPDSTKLVYVGHSDKGDNLWLVDLQGAVTGLTTWERSQLRPTFSPSGDRVAFYANHDDPARFDLYVVEPKAGATPTRLLSGVVMNAAGPAWTPDGKGIVAVLDDDDKLDPIVAVTVADAVQKPLDLGTVNHGDLALAKDAGGKTWLAYVAQGKKSDAARTFDRLFLADVSALVP